MWTLSGNTYACTETSWNGFQGQSFSYSCRTLNFSLWHNGSVRNCLLCYILNTWFAMFIWTKHKSDSLNMLLTCPIHVNSGFLFKWMQNHHLLSWRVDTAAGNAILSFREMFSLKVSVFLSCFDILLSIVTVFECPNTCWCHHKWRIFLNKRHM